MTSRLTIAGLAGTLMLAATLTPAFAQMHAHPAPAADGLLALSPAWSRATPPGAKVGGGYITIENKGTAPDRLISATADVAGIVEIHEMAVIDGVMRMRALDKGLEIGPGGKVELKPGGFHIMFINLKRQLKEGETVKGELVFEKAGRKPVEYRVMPIGARGDMTGHKH